MDRHQQTYLEESRELLAELEEALLAIEREPGNAELVGKIFRVMHTIKGSGAMFGYAGIAGFTHELETAFDCVRSGSMAVTVDLITLTLASRDHIANLLERARLEQEPEPEILAEGERILAKLRTLLPVPARDATSTTMEPQPKDEPGAAQPQSVFRIRFNPPKNILLTGSKPENLVEELKEMGKCDAIEHSLVLPPGEVADPDLYYQQWDILLSTSRDPQAIRDVFIFVEDGSEIRIEALGASTAVSPAAWQELVGLLREIDDAPLQRLNDVVEQHRNGVTAVKATPTPARLTAPQEHKGIQHIKVPSERLDKLVDLVGELVIAQARLAQSVSGSRDPVLTAISEQVESLVWELRDSAMGMRMLPIGTIFGKFRRLVRDLSGELGKEIELVTEGDDTELDKTVIEQLGDPIVHMIRNSIDHGIEAPDDRQAAGKPRRGTIRLSAAHVGASVHLTITDDGRGLDATAIRKKGIELGMIAPEASLTEQELFAMIFRPGFSTAKALSTVSGRGVGMDVVRRNIEELGGQIEVKSTIGTGTSVTLKLPLTLAIVEGLLVEVGGDYFILPLVVVKECVELQDGKGRSPSEDHFVKVRGDLIPYIRLREFFGKPGAPPAVEYVVVVETEREEIGFAVDVVCGERQTVVKALGTMYRNVQGVSGATILGDGTVALVVDVPSVINAVLNERRLPLQRNPL